MEVNYEENNDLDKRLLNIGFTNYSPLDIRISCKVVPEFRNPCPIYLFQI